MIASDGLELATDAATYTQSDEVVRAPGKVTFRRGRMSGTSVGASYDKLRDVLWLLDQARITVAPDASGQGAVSVTAGAAGYARRDRYMRFERGVHMVRGGQAVDADGALAYLQPDADVLQQLELRGRARVAGVGQGANGLEAMNARDMNLTYADNGQTLQHATLIGAAVVQLAGGAGQPGQRLAAEAIEIELAADGQTVQVLGAQDNVQLDIPPAGGGPARQIRSQALDAGGAPGAGGLTQARFTGGVEFRETSPATAAAPASQRIVKAGELATRLRSGLASIDEATFTGAVSIQDGPRTAAGPAMVYDIAKGSLALSVPEADERAFVQVSDERVSIEARAIDWTADGTRMVADGRVKSVLKGEPAEGRAAGRPAGQGPAPAGAVRRPSMFSGSQPVNATAGHLVYNRDTGRAEYTGDAQLWQGQTSIKADAITLDESTGNLTASGKVRSVMRVESPAPEKPGPAAPEKTSTNGGTGSAPTRRATDTIATAGDLVYDEAARRATYTTEARLVGEQGDLRGARIELYFDETGRGLDRLEAYDQVAFRSAPRPDGSTRWGHGARLTYFAADERYVLSGPRATVFEQLPRECRETTGRTLTFFRATDSITVDGNDSSRTQTKVGGKCPEQVP